MQTEKALFVVKTLIHCSLEKLEYVQANGIGLSHPCVSFWVSLPAEGTREQQLTQALA